MNEEIADQTLTAQQKLQIVLRIGREIQGELRLNKLLTTLGDIARDILESERCSIFMYDSKKDELWTIVAHGVELIHVPANKGVVGYAALSKSSQCVVDCYQDYRFNASIDKHTGYKTRNILATPILDSRHNVMGVFQAINKTTGDYNDTDVDLLQLLVDYVSAALERANQFLAIKETQTKLVQRLAHAAEYKDTETESHTRRVGRYAGVLARAYGLREDECDTLELVAPIHDLGKIGMPDRILLKPEKLSEVEFIAMKQHPMIGYRVLNDDNPVLRMAALVSRDHHEHWDGGGYPQGLVAEDISIYGRIVALADVFDALSSKRPFKEAWSLDKINEKIRQLSGSQFEPKLVDLYFASMPEILIIREQEGLR